MKEMNLRRLLNSCCVQIPEDVKEALFDYLIEIDVDLNELNVDDLWVNGIQFISHHDIDNEKKYIILLINDEGIYVLL